MGLKDKIKVLIKEAELYKTQGLLTESKVRYESVISLIESRGNVKNKDSLIDNLNKKIAAVDKLVKKIDDASEEQQLSQAQQDAIIKLFSMSQNDGAESAAMEAALSLAKFGQYDRAIVELEKLISPENADLQVAKNLLRCHLGYDPDKAFERMERFKAEETYPPERLEKLELFFNDIAQKKGLKQAGDSNDDAPVLEIDAGIDEEPPVLEIDEPSTESDQADSSDVDYLEDEDVMDISSVGITMPEGPRNGKMVEFEVAFQSGNVISITLSDFDLDVVDTFKTVSKMPDTQFFSPIAMFPGTAMIVKVDEIEAGPKKGDYNVDIKIAR